MRNINLLNYSVSVIMLLLVFFGAEAQIVSQSRLTTQKQMGYGLEVLGLCIITYSNFNAHYKSLDLRESYYNSTNFYLNLELSEKKVLALKYSDNYSKIERKNLNNTILGGSIILGGALLNIISDNNNSKFKKRQNRALFFESVGAGIIIGSVINRQSTITENISLFNSKYTYAGASVEGRLIAVKKLERDFHNLQNSRIGIMAGGIVLFYGVLTHFTSLRFIDNVSIYSMGNNISIAYNF